MTVDELHILIGKQLNYRGQLCKVIEILDDGPSLVLETIINDSIIQANAYGEATRLAPQTWTVPVYPEGSKEPNPLILLLLQKSQ